MLLLRQQPLLCRVEIRGDVLGKHQLDLGVVGDVRVRSDRFAYKGGSGVLCLQEANQDLGIANGECIQYAQRLVDLHVGEGLGRHVQVGPLHQPLHQHVALHQHVPGGFIVHGIGGLEAGIV